MARNRLTKTYGDNVQNLFHFHLSCDSAGGQLWTKVKDNICCDFSKVYRIVGFVDVTLRNCGVHEDYLCLCEPMNSHDTSQSRIDETTMSIIDRCDKHITVNFKEIHDFLALRRYDDINHWESFVNIGHVQGLYGSAQQTQSPALPTQHITGPEINVVEMSSALNKTAGASHSMILQHRHDGVAGNAFAGFVDGNHNTHSIDPKHITPRIIRTIKRKLLGV